MLCLERSKWEIDHYWLISRLRLAAAPWIFSSKSVGRRYHELLQMENPLIAWVDLQTIFLTNKGNTVILWSLCFVLGSEMIRMSFNFWASFYPLYTPAESVPLDFSLAPEALQLSFVPDILILPSDIKYFVKVKWFVFTYYTHHFLLKTIK